MLKPIVKSKMIMSMFHIDTFGSPNVSANVSQKSPSEKNTPPKLLSAMLLIKRAAHSKPTIAFHTLN